MLGRRILIALLTLGQGYYCLTQGISRPLYANSKCSGRLKLEHSFRPYKCLDIRREDDLESQARFSVGLTGEHDNLKCPTELPTPTPTPPPPPPPLDVFPLMVSGRSTNRVNLVFFSDGYIASEREIFIKDARRLAEDISSNQTFHTVQPLLNFWAAFSPSKESGIGVHGVPKDTPFGLYRDGTELRAVYYSRPEVAKAACDSLGNLCNFPILLGKDPLYGGLGGEFTVVTSSILNGPLVLRHELGHSIIKVGEEYDGGFAYFGVNAAHDLSEPIPWEHWLSNPPSTLANEKLKPRVERSVMPIQVYPWTMLNTTSSWSIKFTSSGDYSRHVVRFSLSGLPHREDLLVLLDGDDLGWVPKPGIGLDRWHYDIHSPNGLASGFHELSFTLLNPKHQGVAQLCSAEILEFGNEDEFVSKPGYYGLYPTFSDLNETSYRPTNEDCLMRDVTWPNFCKVCTERLWLYLLEKVDFIDRINEACVQQHHSSSSDPALSSSWSKVIDLDLLPLAHLRRTFVSPNESYIIAWKKDGSLLPQFTNKTKLELDTEDAIGNYTITVKFKTEEIRVESDTLVSEAHYTVKTKCVGF